MILLNVYQNQELPQITNIDRISFCISFRALLLSHEKYFTSFHHSILDSLNPHKLTNSMFLCDLVMFLTPQSYSKMFLDFVSLDKYIGHQLAILYLTNRIQLCILIKECSSIDLWSFLLKARSPCTQGILRHIHTQ